MYNLEALRRKISKDGLDITIKWLSSEKFPSSIASVLEESNVFSSDGKLNVALLRALV